MYQLYRESPLLVFAIIAANFVLSAWCIYSDPVINNDGVTYLAIAQYMDNGQWREAFDFYSWPFYSVFILAASKVLFVEIETAAYLLNTIFVTSLTLAFVCIVGELSADKRRIIIVAALIILLFPSINKYRSFIIRDFGYLSCYLWSLYFVFRFCSTFRKSHLVLWLVFACLSFLFRFEGIAFLMIAPYFLLLFSASKLPHRRTVLLALSAVIGVCSTALLFWYVNDKYSAMLEMAAITGQNINGLTDLFFANIKDSLGDQPITLVSYLGLLFANLGTMFYELLRRMAGFYLIFAVYAYAKRLTLDRALHRNVWLVFLITNVAALIGFSIYNNFLVSRYTLATALTLLILAPFAIVHLYDKALAGGRFAKLIGVLILIILAGISVDRLTDSTDKMYLKTSGEWLADNVAAEQSVYANNKLIIYYARRKPEEILNHLYAHQNLLEFIETNQLRNYDYLAYQVDNAVPEQRLLRRSLTYQFGSPVNVAQQDLNNFVVIYDLNSREALRREWHEKFGQ